ncbi:MAG: RES family NAD+ phosphorylase [Polaromonas sp.]|uniref:RES family NAD+ phosphorylase n=1 Tax=Polaromonas sp. TaxID=1869339 RepID=UPI002730854D|nr:RES family NAD+ phosphorylase [Polaromonas sp.]MDP1742125.1 RES family NAD+ phosphorylase [Polaromonas sp.]MDP1954059.1 RES family NAD+ phosphorylase [Polaromonas sp.]
MARSKTPPYRGPVKSANPIGILELDRFSEKSLQQWQAASRDLDEIQDSLYFGPEPERRRYRSELIAALQAEPPLAIELEKWIRIVTYRYSAAPLSCAGSLQYIGGRFNAGVDLDSITAWPALYLAEDLETAFQERFLTTMDKDPSGLFAEELALEQLCSHATVVLHGKLSKVFDLTSQDSLAGIARIFRRIKMPTRAQQLKRKMNIQNNACYMVQNARQVYDAMLKHNWRQWPVQFGLPSQSQIVAELIRAAGFEAILYKSTKGPHNCLAVFPDLLQDGSFIALTDEPPESVLYRRLDAESATELEGWDSLPKQQRKK